MLDCGLFSKSDFPLVGVSSNQATKRPTSRLDRSKRSVRTINWTSISCIKNMFPRRLLMGAVKPKVVEVRAESAHFEADSQAEEEQEDNEETDNENDEKSNKFNTKQRRERDREKGAARKGGVNNRPLPLLGDQNETRIEAPAPVAPKRSLTIHLDGPQLHHASFIDNYNGGGPASSIMSNQRASELARQSTSNWTSSYHTRPLSELTRAQFGAGQAAGSSGSLANTSSLSVASSLRSPLSPPIEAGGPRKRTQVTISRSMGAPTPPKNPQIVCRQTRMRNKNEIDVAADPSPSASSSTNESLTTKQQQASKETNTNPLNLTIERGLASSPRNKKNRLDVDHPTSSGGLVVVAAAPLVATRIDHPHAFDDENNKLQQQQGAPESAAGQAAHASDIGDINYHYITSDDAGDDSSCQDLLLDNKDDHQQQHETDSLSNFDVGARRVVTPTSDTRARARTPTRAAKQEAAHSRRKRNAHEERKERSRSIINSNKNITSPLSIATTSQKQQQPERGGASNSRESAASRATPSRNEEAPVHHRHHSGFGLTQETSTRRDSLSPRSSVSGASRVSSQLASSTIANNNQLHQSASPVPIKSKQTRGSADDEDEAKRQPRLNSGINTIDCEPSFGRLNLDSLESFGDDSINNNNQEETTRIKTSSIEPGDNNTKSTLDDNYFNKQPKTPHPIKHPFLTGNKSHSSLSSSNLNSHFISTRSRDRRTPSTSSIPTFIDDDKEKDTSTNRYNNPYQHYKPVKKQHWTIFSSLSSPSFLKSLSTSSIFALYTSRYAREKLQLAFRSFKSWYHEKLTYHKLSRRMEFNERQFETWFRARGSPLNLKRLDRFDQIVIWIAG